VTSWYNTLRGTYRCMCKNNFKMDRKGIGCEIVVLIQVVDCCKHKINSPFLFKSENFLTNAALNFWRKSQR
jgi:hypothetical protein